MPARPFERSTGPGDEREVSDVWLGEREGAQDEPHVGVAHRRGQAAGCPVCHGRCGACDTCERAWRHPGVWQHGTIARRAAPRAAQAAGRSHAVQLPNRAIDHVRCQGRRESAERRRQLAGTKCVWPERRESLTERQLATGEEPDPARTRPRTARACQMGEALQDVYPCPDRGSAARALERLCSWMMHSNVRKMKTVARTLGKEREGIPDWWKRGSTDSFLEGLSFVVQSVRSAARGFRSIAHFRTMILLRLGRLDLTAQKKLACATH